MPRAYTPAVDSRVFYRAGLIRFIPGRIRVDATVPSARLLKP
ncbi:MAG TPA: hypothetical protein VGM88_16640 [Kofleriaceae bacterium]|jgi:hypothetical protein